MLLQHSVLPDRPIHKHPTLHQTDYIYTGASDVSENLRIQKGKAYKADYYNCHKKIPEDCWKKSKITLGKKTIKNYGYLSAEQYVKYRDSYKHIREITFKKNKK